MSIKDLFRRLINDFEIVITNLKTMQPYEDAMMNCNDAMFVFEKEGKMMLVDLREALHHYSDYYYLQPIQSRTGYTLAMKFYINRNKFEEAVQEYLS